MNILGRAKEDLPGIFGRQTDFRSSPVAIEPLPPSNNPTSFDNRFGDWRSSPAGAHRSPVLRELQRYERSDFQGGPQASGQGALAEMPVLQSDSARSFGEVGTFTGDRLIASRQAASSTPAAPIPVASNLPGGGSDFGDGLGDALRGPKTDTHLGLPTRMLSSGIPGITRRDQSQPSSSPEPAPLLGIFSGKPMSAWALPTSVWGLPDNSDAPDEGNWFARLAGAAAARDSSAR